jgi:sec-independent protein translocase protein TatC
MPRREYDEDLFKDTTMSFGDHLEELRACLFKAIVGLVLAFVVALFFGNHVVDFIQGPLKTALTNYYQKKSLDTARDKLKKLQEEGKPLPADPAQVEQLVEKRGLLPQEVYIQPDEMIAPLQARYPGLKRFKLPEKASGQGGGAADQAAKPPQITRDDLLRVFVWRPVEDDERVRVKTLSAPEAFVIFVKASLLLGVLTASPWIFYQIWSFVAAGLYPRERRYVNVYLPFSLGLFLAGAAVAFFLVIEPVLEFLFSFNRWMGIDPDPRFACSMRWGSCCASSCPAAAAPTTTTSKRRERGREGTRRKSRRAKKQARPGSPRAAGPGLS